jgi:hypothetical protein
VSFGRGYLETDGSTTKCIHNSVLQERGLHTLFRFFAACRPERPGEVRRRGLHNVIVSNLLELTGNSLTPFQVGRL